jgi:hypothetical protein
LLGYLAGWFSVFLGILAFYLFDCCPSGLKALVGFLCVFCLSFWLAN